MLNLPRKSTIFQNGGQTVNFRTKVYRKSIKDPHHRFTKNQARRKSDNYRLRYCGFYIMDIHTQITVKQAIFQNGGQTVKFGTKVYRKSIKDLYFRMTKSQTGCKLDHYRLRYHRIYTVRHATLIFHNSDYVITL